jgi:hypothetical protein
MPKNTILAAAAAFVLAAGGAFAQSEHGAATAPAPQEGMAGQGSDMPMMHHGAGRGMMQGGPMMMGHGSGRGAMPPQMMMMMMALVDTDASETLSLEEVQAVHARMFKYADANDDGELTLEEMRTFMHGEATPAAQ